MDGAKAETEVAARERAARVRRGAMVEVYGEVQFRLRFQVESIFRLFAQKVGLFTITYTYL